MPSTVIHEKVGYELSKKLNISSYNYFLGLLAPDAPNLYGFAEKEKRWIAHQRDKDYKMWKENIKNFYKKELDNYPKDFILGYLIHVLTDIIFDDLIYLKIREEIIKDNVPEEESHNYMRLDMDKYYFNELEEIINLLKENNNSYNILNINKELLNNFKLKVINSFPKENKSIYISDGIVNVLITEIVKELRFLND